MFNLYDGQYCDLYIGYCIAEGIEAEILTTLVKWSSYILFDVKPVVNVDQLMETLKKGSI